MDNLEYRVGRFTLKPFRQLLEAGRPITIGRKPLDLLSVLAKAEGALVTKDELMAAVWPRAIVEDNAIQVHIAALRKVLGTDAELLHTVHGLGYRLAIKPAAPAADPAAEAPPETAAATAKPSFSATPRIWIGAVAAVLLIGVTGIGIWLLQPERHWTVNASRPFITSLALEDYPAFSPNGSMLAYTSGLEGGPRAIHVRNLAGSDGIAITNDSYVNVSPAWAADGAHIAYAAQKTGEPCRIMVASVPAGESREAGRCDLAETTTLCWRPKSEFLYFTDVTASGEGTIDRLDIESGARQRLMHSGIAVAWVDAPQDPQCSPDGRWLSYRVWISYDTFRIVILNLDTGAQKNLARIEGAEIFAAWSEDSRTLLVSKPAATGSEIIAFPVDGGAPYRVYAIASTTGRLSVGAGGQVALETDASRFNLARVIPTPATDPDIVDTADRATWSPTFAPDGTLAFLSDRSGENAIWTMKPGAAPEMLLSSGTERLERLRWSPDGSKLVVVVPSKGGITMRVLTAAGAGVTSIALPSIGYGNPTWTPDGKALIGFDRDRMLAVRTDLTEPAKHVPVADHNWDGVTYHDGKTYSIRVDHPGIWEISKQPQLLTGKYPAPYQSALTFLGDDVLVPDYGKDGVRLFAQPLAGGPDRLIGYAPGARNINADFVVNPKTGEILYVAAAARDTNIDLLALTKR